MQRLLEISASNAITVSVLALVIFVVSCLYWKPALIHSLWVLLLIKLITPPIFEMPIPAALRPSVQEVASPDAESRVHPPASRSAESPSIRVVTEEPAVISPTGNAADGLVANEEPATLGLDPTPVLNPKAPPRVNSDSLASETKSRTPSRASANSWQSWGLFGGMLTFHSAVACVWLLGTCILVVKIANRIWQFRRLLRHAQPAPSGLEQQMRRLARQIGLAHAPRLLMLPGIDSPMLWGVGRATVLFPVDLASRLDRQSCETLMLHELSHYRRCDHWVRYLEIVVTALYWWHPCVWWGRRELRAAEEECCDAWVVSLIPQSRSLYAKALMSVIDGLAVSRLRMPPAACGVSNFRSASNRLKAIMLGTHEPRLNGWTRAAIAVIAMPCLFLVPTLAQSDDSDVPAASAPTAESLPPVAPTAKAPGSLPKAAESGEFEPMAFSLDLQSEQIREFAFSSSGNRLVAAYGAGDTSGSLRVWDVSRKVELASFREPRGVYSADISPDGKRVASTSFSDRLIRVREVETGLIVGQIRASQELSRVRFSPDGRHLATASLDGALQLWNLAQVRAGEQPATEPARKIASLETGLGSVAFLDDGKRIAVGGGQTGNDSFGMAAVWNVESGNVIVRLEGIPDFVIDIAASPNGRLLATVGSDGLVRLWNPQSGQLMKVLSRNTSSLRSADFSPTSALLATGGNDGAAALWNVDGYNESANFAGNTDSVMCVRFAPDGNTLATGGDDQIIRLWNLSTREEIGHMEPPSEEPSAVLAVACSPDGRYVATAHGDRSVRLRDIFQRTIVRQFTGHDDVVTSLAFSPDGSTLATGSYDSTVKLWDVDSGVERRTLQGHRSWVMSVAFAPNGETLASSGYDKTVRLWNAATGKEVKRLTGHTASVRSVAFSPDGKLLATGGSDRTARTWNAESGEQLQLLEGHTGAIRSVAFHPSGETLATASEDATLRLWDLANGDERSVLRAHAQMVWSLAFSPGGRTLVSGGMNGFIFTWDGQTGARRQQIMKNDSDIISGLAFSPKGYLVSVSYDSTIKRWTPKPAPLEEIAHRDTGGWHASFVAFTPNGELMLATDKFSGFCRVWNVRTGELVRTFRAQSGHIRCATLSSDGRLLAVAQPDKPIRIWDVQAAMIRRELPTHETIKSLAFSPDGRRLAVAGDDRQARIWDLEKEKVIVETELQSEQLHGIAFSPDGKKFVTCSGNWGRSREGEVKLWDAGSGSEIALLGSHRGRINAVRFAAGGSQVVAATNEGGMLLTFDLRTQEKSELHMGSPASILSLAINEDGSRVAVGRSTGELSLWDLKSRRKLLDYVGHTPEADKSSALVWSLAFSPDGRMLASAAFDQDRHTVRLWPTSRTKPIPVKWDGNNR